MKPYLLLIASALILASCSTAYKTGQTPDDVYYSPERQRDEYVRVDERDNRQYNNYQSDEELREDRYLRMKTSYRRYSTLDDYDCYCYTGSNYNRYYNYYRYNNVGYYNNSWYWNNSGWNVHNAYYYNPYYNNPYYSGYVAGNVRPVYNRPRTGNLNTYSNGNTDNSNIPRNNGKVYSNGSSREDNNYRGSGTNAGGLLRNVFGTGNNNSSSSSSNNASNSPSSSSSSSSSSSNSAPRSAPARKF
jgi:hypothetical protein